jgi:dihydroxyacetone kinase-like predicted kinase
MKPSEGTILTVSRLAAAAAAEAAKEGDIGAALDRAIEAGRAALAETVNMNPVLRRPES